MTWDNDYDDYEEIIINDDYDWDDLCDDYCGCNGAMKFGVLLTTFTKYFDEDYKYYVLFCLLRTRIIPPFFNL